jgi:predicted amidohydrolase
MDNSLIIKPQTMSKKIKISILVSFLTAFAVFSTVSNTATGQNIVTNPGFETSKSDVSAWKITGPVVAMQPNTAIDGSIKFSGSQSLRMQSSNPNCHGRAVQVVPVKGGQTYQFAARFRADKIASLHKSVMIRIRWMNEEVQTGYSFVYDVADEKNGWYLASDKVKAIENSTTAEISLEFRWSTGTVWWDDVSMTAVAPDPPRNVRVATFYFRPHGPTVEKNISMMSEMLDKAGKAGCDIVCLPEGWPTCDTGLGMTKTEANTIGGSASKMVAAKAKEYKMYIVSGLYNWVGDTLKNIAVLYDRNGNIQGVYEKIQLPDSETEAGAVPGSTFPVFTTDFGRIGILICWDSAFPEISRILALNGAEMLFCPIWGDVRGPESWKVTARARAIDNGVYFITNIFDGHSVIVNPAGDILQESGTQGTMITATVDLNFNPPWDWIGNAGRGVWKGVWRQDRRSDIFGELGEK